MISQSDKKILYNVGFIDINSNVFTYAHKA